jgi:ATP-dependent protease ClpP protease subunit
MRSWYAIRARDTGAEVSIYDEIGAYGVSAKSFLDELASLPGDGPLTLRLNSPGGSVFDAVAIYNALKRHPGPVSVWIDGIAASAASYVAMAGDEVVMPENAFLMIHDPSGFVMGTADDMRAMAEALDKIKGSRRLRREVRRRRGRYRRADGQGDLARRRGGSRARLRRSARGAGADRGAVRRRPVPKRTSGARRGGRCRRRRCRA